MKQTLYLTLFIILASCKQQHAQSVQRIVLNPADSFSGYYLAVEPKSKKIDGVLVLLSGFSQNPNDVFPETKLETIASENNILTIAFAGGYKIYADSVLQSKMTVMLADVVKRYKVDPSKFVLGGFSAGGNIVLRYTELCNQYPGKFPIKPAGVFMVDSPIDVFTLWDFFERIVAENRSEPAVHEANAAMDVMRNDFGVPRENVAAYTRYNPFSVNRSYSDNEKYLLNTAVRAYHDVDIAWRIINRNQTVHYSNYEVTAELINYLVLNGNKKAEFMQSFKTGYRSNGQRHPHSWSIVDEVECIKWMKLLL